MNQLPNTMKIIEPDFRKLFESAPGLYLALLPDAPKFTIVAVSDEYARQTMTKRDSILGKGIFEIFPDNPDDPAATGVRNLKASLNRVVQLHVSDAMAVQKYDIRRPETEGGGFEERHWSPTNFPVFDSPGKVAYVIHQVEDVTEFVRAERDLVQSAVDQKIYLEEIKKRKEVEKELRESQEQLRLMIDSIKDYAIFMLDTNGAVASWNEGAAQIKGYRENEIIGRSFTVFYTKEDQESGKPGKELGIAAAKGQSKDEGWRVRKDGSRFWASVVISAIRDKSGTLRGFSKLTRDISELREAQERLVRANEELERRVKGRTLELQQLNERLRDSDRVKTQFFANVSHELRTPLTLILGPVERLLAGGPSDDLRAILERIQRNAFALLKQVNDLLDIAKLEAGKVEVTYSEVDLAKLVRHAASNFSSVASEKRCRLSVECPNTLFAQADAEKVEHTVLNLLSNAFKFTPDGGRVRCTVREDQGAQRAVIEVADSGPGVPEKYRKQIFERFFQTEDSSSRRFGGTGLGLAIVKELTAIQHGHVQVASAPEGGALFTVDIPLKAPVGTAIRPLIDAKPAPFLVASPIPLIQKHKWEQVPPKPLTGAPEHELGRPLVLVVDDTPDMREYICESLGSQFSIETANNGREGLEKVRKLRPDLIVSDIMMPEMSGDQMFREIRARPETAMIPVILLTAKADEQLRIELLREGAQDYLTKPFNPEELKSKVRNQLAVRAAEAKYRGLLESAQDAIVVVDSDGRIKFANHQTASWFGYSNEELIGRFIEILLPERYRAVHVGERNQYLHDPIPRQMGERIVDLCGRRKDGSEFPVSIALSPLQTPEGLLVTAIVRDITEMKKLSGQALLAREEAIATVSHDLKNPLSAIQTSLELLSSKSFSHEMRERLVEKTLSTVDSASKQMSHLIQDLLDYSKVETHRLIVERKPEDVASILSEVFGIFEPIARDKSIELKQEIAMGLGPVYCERRRIVRVLSNLMSNAIKFSPPGSTATVLAELRGGDILFAVRDNGPGITPEQLPHVFERYWQAEETARKGSGLGLAIARGFVEAHHGKIWAETRVGHGSTFYFTLPGPEKMAESA